MSREQVRYQIITKGVLSNGAELTMDGWFTRDLEDEMRHYIRAIVEGLRDAGFEVEPKLIYASEVPL